MANEIYTVGHSTRPIEGFLNLIKAYGIEALSDVRTIPRSRHNPDYNEDHLKNVLKEVGIQYIHLPKLGGLRHTTKSSLNTGWRNRSFRGFADYMETPPFWEGIQELERLAKQFCTAIMCAEVLPWRCHRSLIADALTIHRWNVFHIINKNKAQMHQLTPFLKIKKGQFIYSESVLCPKN